MFKIITTIIFLSSVISYSQVNQDWVQRYNGPSDLQDIARSIAVDPSGNVYVTGSSYGMGLDYATIKYNSAGVQQWVQRYSGPHTGGDDEAFSIAVDASGNSYVTGYSQGNASGYDYEATTIKYNTNGVQQWVARYLDAAGGPDRGYSIAVDGTGNVYVTGFANTLSVGLDYVTIKYNSAGVQQWAQLYNGPGNYNDVASSIAVDASGNVYVTGYSWGGNAIRDDYATIKYNSAGVLQWVQQYNGPGNDEDIADAIVVDASGNVYVTGYSFAGSNGGYDYATIKYNSTGVQQWLQRYNGPDNSDDKATGMKIDASGNVYVTGWSYGLGEDYATIKYNTNGVQQWVARYNGYITNSTDDASAIAIDTSGNVYVTGQSEGNYTDYATVKYNSAGVQQWVERYTGFGFHNQALSIASDNSGHVYVTGSSEYAIYTASKDYLTIQYSQPVGIKPISSEIPKEFSLSQNYPNPFNPNSKIRFQIAKLRNTRLVVFDVLGREISTLVNEQLKPGTYEADFDGSKYASGVYFYRLVAGDNTKNGGFVETKKMILVK